MKRFSAPLALLLVLLSAAAVGSGPDPGTDATLGRLGKQRRDAARRTYEALWANYRERLASEDTLYRWSLRWLEAERQLTDRPADQAAAAAGHWERMRALERLMGNLQRAGQATVQEVSAAEFYRAEAEIWLLQAKARKDR